MEWYNYLAAFFSGAFLANALPHLVNGVSGDRFPTPFSKPRGKGLSSPVTNVLWGMLNIVLGYVLLRIGRVHGDNTVSLIILFIAVTAKSLGSAINFQKKDKE
jgi:hypothetical protein